MKKPLLLSIGAAMVAVAVIDPAVASSDPTASANSANVTNIPYGQAIRILKSQGARYTFGGSVGSDVPQSQCVVSQQTLTSGGKYRLTLDCTKAAVDAAAGSAVAAPAPARPAPGAAAGPGAAPAPGAGQGTYGAPVGVPVAVG